MMLRRSSPVGEKETASQGILEEASEAMKRTKQRLKKQKNTGKRKTPFNDNFTEN